MTHPVVIEQNGKVQHYDVECAKPAVCTLCESRAKKRAKLTHVRAG